MEKGKKIRVRYFYALFKNIISFWVYLECYEGVLEIPNNISHDQAFEPNSKRKTRGKVFALWRIIKNALIGNLREITGLLTFIILVFDNRRIFKKISTITTIASVSTI
ncbi:hypothetical protein BpHYR1_045461 [Brachionus plicatilis]|uniref:Uncharacterized protein n=1 Tax=Brachionus plicatilis TaxID=10195 RepID=A0A3M7T491_BRAPC|nr:hypothetical protein BpHYR1_045461 [Brachionus plicatilis]